MSKLLSAVSDIGSGLVSTGSGVLKATGGLISAPGAALRDVGDALSSGKSMKKASAQKAAAASTAEAKNKVLTSANEEGNAEKLYVARIAEKFDNDVKHLSRVDSSVNQTLDNIQTELDEDNIAAADAARAANHATNLLSQTLQRMGASDIAADFRALQQGGVTASEFNKILGNSIKYALGSTQTALSDVASAHGKISALKDTVSALSISLQSVKDTAVISLGRVNSLLKGRGLMPTGKMMDDINNGAIFFGENGLRRLDVVTFVMSLVALKSVRIYAQEDTNTSQVQLFSKGEELRMITGFRIVQAGEEIGANDTDILGKAGSFASGKVSALREKGRFYDDTYLVSVTVLPTVAPNVGSLAKIAASGFLSGSINNVMGQFIGLFTESISNFITGQRDSDFHKGG